MRRVLGLYPLLPNRMGVAQDEHWEDSLLAICLYRVGKFSKQSKWAIDRNAKKFLPEKALPVSLFRAIVPVTGEKWE